MIFLSIELNIILKNFFFYLKLGCKEKKVLKSYMNKNLSSNKFENNEFTMNHEKNHYKSLSSILKEISEIISLLEKKVHS